MKKDIVATGSNLMPQESDEETIPDAKENEKIGPAGASPVYPDSVNPQEHAPGQIKDL